VFNVSQRNVETVIGKLATDEALRRDFEHNPGAVLAKLVADGMELTACELWALDRVDPRELARFARAVGPRLQKSDLRCCEPGAMSGPEDRKSEGGL
jgi:hypothetical protein